jgi:hypothetical protein
MTSAAMKKMTPTGTDIAHTIGSVSLCGGSTRQHGPGAGPCIIVSKDSPQPGQYLPGAANCDPHSMQNIVRAEARDAPLFAE